MPASSRFLQGEPPSRTFRGLAATGSMLDRVVSLSLAPKPSGETLAPVSAHRLRGRRRVAVGPFLSAGFARYASGRDAVFAPGLNWGRPNRESLGSATDDPYTVEAYDRFRLFDRPAITPHLQSITYPASNPGEDLIGVAGRRARLAFCVGS